MSIENIIVIDGEDLETEELGAMVEELAAARSAYVYRDRELEEFDQ